MKYLLFFIIFFPVSNCVTGQANSLSNPIPPSPEVNSLFKFSNVPVSRATGIPDISIPLFELKAKRLSIPIALKYHSGGVRVTDVASSVGMGWALDYGGVITQTIRGVDDFNTNYGRAGHHTNVLFPDTCDVKAAAEAQADPEPDIFSYTFLNYSGSFCLDSNAHAVEITRQKLKIDSFYYSGDPVGIGVAWSITDKNGVQYIFESTEPTTCQNYVLAGQSPGLASPNGKIHGVNTRSYYLDKIIDLPGDTVFFNYDDSVTTTDYIYTSENENFSTSPPFSYGVGGGCDPNTVIPSLFLNWPNRNYLQQITVRKRIKSITYKDGTIQFISGGFRCDLSGDSYLGKVLILNSSNTKIKEYDLDYNYLIGNQWVSIASVNCSSEIPSPNNDGSNNFVKRRLYLTGVDEVDGNNNKIGSYAMAYQDSVGLPDRYSAQQDLWGYYNGNGYSSLLQNISPSGDTVENLPTYTIGGKDANFSFAKEGILTRITYPTGGYTTLTYEANVQPYANQDTVFHSAQTFTVASGVSGDTLTKFTINNIAGSVQVPFELDTCMFGASKTRGSFSIINTQNGSVVYTESVISSKALTNHDFSLYLPNGSYALLSQVNNFPCSYTIKIFSWADAQSGFTMVNRIYGGIRIKSIRNHDPFSGSTLERDFQYNFSSGLSSMVMFNQPADFGNFLFQIISSGADLNPNNQFCAYLYEQVSSSTHYPIATPQNGLFGYSYVTETERDSVHNVDNGYSIYQIDTSMKDLAYQTTEAFTGSFYSSVGPMPDKFPWAPSGDLSWARGKPTSEEHYKRKSDGTYYCAQRQKFYYTTHFQGGVTNAYTAAYRLRISSPVVNMNVCPDGLVVAQHDVFPMTTYSILGGYQTLDSTIKQDFDDAANVTQTTSYYQYDTSNLEPSIIKVSNSKNEWVISNLYYPGDYLISGTVNNARAAGIQYLNSINDIDAIVESTTQKSNRDGSNLRNISSTFTTYSSSFPFPDTIYATESSQTISGFMPAILTAYGSVIDNRYAPRIVIDSYDGSGNVTQQHKVSDVFHSYIWDYNKDYPISEAIGAAQSDIAYTSFEADGWGNWSIPDTTRSRTVFLTGSRSYTLTGSNSITKTSLNSSTTYIIGYWGLSGNAITVNGLSGSVKLSIGNWTYYEVQVSGATSVTVGGTGGIDELRLYPKGALMTTYTYLPLVGMTSQGDPSGKLTYYTYDGLGRLKLIKDQYGNILKRYDYQYQTQNQ